MKLGGLSLPKSSSAIELSETDIRRNATWKVDTGEATVTIFRPRSDQLVCELAPLSCVIVCPSCNFNPLN